ncbi:sulfite exporter TauE/SafE family protein [Halomonas sp.]|uniref:sulfite exporter TauE/SafE family protein n=1 Tax=Halomonas sp. TaxID=1486246 RepID=UPI00257A8C29|nr:sulfite exporter TauE/SafE family protein [Halomonas sp.]MCJ8285245.1 sulfite exporter TauE/SafE family protein [Halomonas sp.]NQY70297.1 sulfite exporter TauE/SafE family protein [Halomonas sp.]
MEWLAAISPLSPVVSLGLILLSGVTSMISASLGVGGGTLLIMTMAQVMPAAALIPVHGMVQLGSNGGRLAMSWRHVHWPLLATFVPGALVGALVAGWLLIRLPSGVLELSIAAFVLYTLWGPGLPKRALGRLGTLIAGAVTTLLSSFVGASGPMVAAFVKQHGNSRQGTVATFAACMTFQHLTKAFVFGVAGFLFADWLWLILLMIGLGVLGTWLGLRLLQHVSERRFDTGFRVVLTALSLRLVWLGMTRLLT